LLILFAEQFGVTKDSVLMSYLTLLEEELARRIMGERSGVSLVKNRLHTERNRYLAIFKSKYLLHTDLNYDAYISGGEINGVDRVIKILSDKKMGMEEYLNWFFEEITRIRGFNAPSLTSTFSNHFLHGYLTLMKDESKRRREIAKVATANKAIFLRVSALTKKGHSAETDAMMKAYNSGQITGDELKKRVEEMEERDRERIRRRLNDR